MTFCTDSKLFSSYGSVFGSSSDDPLRHFIMKAVRGNHSGGMARLKRFTKSVFSLTFCHF